MPDDFVDAPDLVDDDGGVLEPPDDDAQGEDVSDAPDDPGEQGG